MKSCLREVPSLSVIAQDGQGPVTNVLYTKRLIAVGLTLIYFHAVYGRIHEIYDGAHSAYSDYRCEYAATWDVDTEV